MGTEFSYHPRPLSRSAEDDPFADLCTSFIKLERRAYSRFYNAF